MKGVLPFLMLTFSLSASAVDDRYRFRHASVDIEQYVLEQAPKLAQQAESISHWAAYWELDPVALMTSLELGQRLGWWRSEDLTPKLIGQLSSRLSRSSRSIAASSAHFAGVPPNDRLQRQWQQRYRQLALPVSIEIEANTQTEAQAQVNLDSILPIEFDRDWYFNGAHTWTGDDDGQPMSSIDLLIDRNHQWGDDTSNVWVAAAHDGTFNRFSRCFARITHESGWFTDYYHLENIQLLSGESVTAGQFIANYANDLPTALCDGGHSNLPHLHMALGRDGRRISITKQTFSGYRVHPGRFSYDADPRYMWLEKGQQRLRAWVDPIQHSLARIIDFVYNGMWYESSLPGHGLNLVTMPMANGQQNVFVVLFTYDDDGSANFYSGNINVDQWELDRDLEIPLFQSAGGGFSEMRAIDFDSPDQYSVAGSIMIRLTGCSTGLAQLNLTERSGGGMVAQDWQLSKLIGVPISLCETTD